MANQEAGERTLVLGEERLTLKFTTSSFLELEDYLGIGAGEIEQQMARGTVGFKTLVGLIWAGTRKHHRRTLRQPSEIPDLIDEAEDIREVWKTCMEAYQAGQPGLPKIDEEEEEAPKGKSKGPKSVPNSPGEDS